MAEPPPSGTGQQDKSYFKNSVAKDGKVRLGWSPPARLAPPQPQPPPLPERACSACARAEESLKAAGAQVTAFAKAAAGGAKKAADHVSTEVKLSRQYEGASSCQTRALARASALPRRVPSPQEQSCVVEQAPGLTVPPLRVSVPRMEWEGVWASQYPSNDGKDGRVDLIRLDKDRTGKIVATKLTGA